MSMPVFSSEVQRLVTGLGSWLRSSRRTDDRIIMSELADIFFGFRKCYMSCFVYVFFASSFLAVLNLTAIVQLYLPWWEQSVSNANRAAAQCSVGKVRPWFYVSFRSHVGHQMMPCTCFVTTYCSISDRGIHASWKVMDIFPWFFRPWKVFDVKV